MDVIPKINRIIKDINPMIEILKNSLGKISLRKILIKLGFYFLNIDGAIIEV